MLKKIFLSILIITFSFFAFVWTNASYTNCKYDENSTTLWSFLDWCKPKKLAWNWDYAIESWLKDLVNRWIENIALILWILAVWMLVYAGLLMQLSAWEDEKLKKSKNIIKWTAIWFLALISASSIIYLVVNLVYSLAWS
jgi:hypothetical protein